MFGNFCLDRDHSYVTLKEVYFRCCKIWWVLAYCSITPLILKIFQFSNDHVVGQKISFPVMTYMIYVTLSFLVNLGNFGTYNVCGFKCCGNCWKYLWKRPKMLREQTKNVTGIRLKVKLSKIKSLIKKD